MSDPSRTIVITGASAGLGLALAAECLRRGHRVLGSGRDPERVDRARERLAAMMDTAVGTPAEGAGLAAGEGRLELAVADVGDGAAVQRWAEDLLARHGSPDVVVNNAGVMNTPAPLWEVPADEFDRLLDVNVAGTVRVIRAFLPAMIAARGGVVVNLSSGWGRVTAPEVAPYCASKWAIEGLTRALAQELPPGLATVALNPGIIDTAMLRQCFGDQAGAFPDPTAWAPAAADLILGLGPQNNGAALTV
jgi:NAD(P)-dependent dehydrogenase (short-subunit alcohol dehydrogenase family)